nr:hypothetical protein GCM10020093_105700 [Planobispora longispora]
MPDRSRRLDRRRRAADPERLRRGRADLEPDRLRRGFRLSAAHSGKCVGIIGNSTSAGKAAIQQACMESAFQTWGLELVSGSTYRVVNSGSDKCLNVKDSSTAAGAGCSRTPATR